MRFHHFGILCKDIEKTREWVKQTHSVIEESPPTFDPHQQATLCLLRCKDGLAVELIAGERFNNLLKKGITYYHICYTVESIEETVDTLTKQGAVLFAPPKEAVLFENKRVAFLYSPMGIIELVEDPQ